MQYSRLGSEGSGGMPCCTVALLVMIAGTPIVTYRKQPGSLSSSAMCPESFNVCTHCQLGLLSRGINCT